jgi:hypothetical protein
VGVAWQGPARPAVDVLLNLLSFVMETGLLLRARIRRAA